MSLKKNILANYISQIFVTLIGIIMVPIHLRYMGAEAYGLVGFFSMVQSFFQLLDMGLSPTLTRETARFRGGAVDSLSLRRLVRAMEGIFIIIAVLGFVGITIGSDWIANRWLQTQQLSINEVKYTIIIIALIVALRWVCGLYRGAISGFEHLVWLSGFNMLIATARFVLVIPYFIYVGTSPTDFFSYQLAVAFIEIIVLILQMYKLVPPVDKLTKIPWQWSPLRRVLKFSISIAFTSSVWVLVTQTDKLILSKLLPLGDYAYFTMVVMVAAGIMTVSGPIAGAYIPRFNVLAATNNDEELYILYRQATQLVAVVAVPIALVMGIYSKEVLLLWTGNMDFASRFAPVLTLYSFGNGLLAISAFPGFLQGAKGDLRLHVIGNALFVVLLIPGLIIATYYYGATGAGYAWLSMNVLYFLFWIPLIHHRFQKGLHLSWLTHDIMGIAISCGIGVGIAKLVSHSYDNRLSTFIQLVLTWVFALILVTIGSSLLRNQIKIKWKALFQG